ncbi:MAG: hypothetical protein GXO26_04390 [Crenarchaeota archaeon]|nr:hypothetical protein [Thermoproteota archaeon]
MRLKQSYDLYYEDSEGVDVKRWIIRIILIGLLLSLIVVAYYLYMLCRSYSLTSSPNLAVIKLVDNHIKCVTSGKIIYYLGSRIYAIKSCERGQLLNLSNVFCIGGRNAVVCG